MSVPELEDGVIHIPVDKSRNGPATWGNEQILWSKVAVNQHGACPNAGGQELRRKRLELAQQPSTQEQHPRGVPGSDELLTVPDGEVDGLKHALRGVHRKEFGNRQVAGKSLESCRLTQQSLCGTRLTVALRDGRAGPDAIGGVAMGKAQLHPLR